MIAYEMARQLRAEGGQVDAVVMIRTPVQVLRYWAWHRRAARLVEFAGVSPDRRVDLLRRLRWYLADFEARSGRDRLRFFATKWEKLRQVLANRLQGPSQRLEVGRPDDGSPGVTNGNQATHEWSVADTYMQACDDYVPGAYDGPRDSLLAPGGSAGAAAGQGGLVSSLQPA